MCGEKMEDKNKKIIYLTIIALFFALSVSMVALKTTKVANQAETSREAVETALNILNEENQLNTLISKKEIENNFINLVYENENGTYKSYFINAKNGEQMNPMDIIIPEKTKEYEAKMLQLLELKYPKFVTEALTKEDVIKAYQIRDNDLFIYYSNVTTTPAMNEKFTLKINYNEIKEYLNFPVTTSLEYENENGFQYDKNKKAIALTFDDGPNGKMTERLIKVFQENKMHATFFMVGSRMESSPSILLDVLNAGNEIGGHSYNHKNLVRLTKEEIKEDERKTKEIYKKITGKELTLLRPPYGNVNETMKQNMDFVFVNWNIDTEDWRYKNKDHVYDSIINTVEDGDIILMHDLYESTIEAVEKLLPELYSRGFQVVTISELANLKGVNLENKKVYRQIKEAH